MLLKGKEKRYAYTVLSVMQRHSPLSENKLYREQRKAKDVET